jgi:hypothetical protein
LDTKLKVDLGPANNLAGRTSRKGRNNNVPHLTITSPAIASLALMQAAATLPTPADMSAGLTEAWMSQGVQSNETIQFRLEPLNSCVLKENPAIAATQSLINTITHEPGHILISPNFHCQNEKSIMFWIVGNNQSVLPEDKAMLGAKLYMPDISGNGVCTLNVDREVAA